MIVVVSLFLLFVSVFTEAFIYTDDKLWKKHRSLSLVTGIIVMISMLILLNGNTSALLLVVGILSLYRIVNLGRLRINRLPTKHLKSTTMRSFIVIVLAQAIIIVFWQLITYSPAINLAPLDGLHVITVTALFSSLIILATTIYKLIKSRPVVTQSISDSELPTVTIAIAARNETPNLTACIESILTDNYPKLEILVLDDESQDNTAEIIKSFAQSGVRFIKHQNHPGDWLAKNKAYQTLLEQASGEVILYLGVDVRLHENAIKGLLEEYISSDVDMLTVIPKRTKSGFVAAFVQPMRYWWELALPKQILKRPPALSTCWMVNRLALDKIGGFKTYKRSIIPEEHLAKLFNNNGRYSYTRTNKQMLVTTHKDFLRQWDTSVRTRYPHAHRRPESVFAQSVLMFVLVIMPFILLPFVAFGGIFSAPYSLFVYITVVAYITSHVLISTITNPAAGWLAPINLPVAVGLDIAATNISMFKYEFSKIIWKGRDVAPVKLKTIDKLPELPSETKNQDLGRRH